MAETSLTGQDLLDLANARLLGYANAVDTDVLMSYLNEAKDEVWSVLKNLEDEYFVTSTQSTDATKVNYFGPMSTTVREYTLPVDFKEIKFIEILDKGYEQTVFTFKNITDNDFRSARRAASVDSTLTPSVEYFYAIVGKNQFVMAQFPEVAFQKPVLWYTRGILDFELSDQVDEIVLPYTKKIANYAVKRITLGLQDTKLWAAWKEEWKADLMTIASTAAPRNEADPEFVDDFLG